MNPYIQALSQEPEFVANCPKTADNTDFGGFIVWGLLEKIDDYLQLIHSFCDSQTSNLASAIGSCADLSWFVRTRHSEGCAALRTLRC